MINYSPCRRNSVWAVATGASSSWSCYLFASDSVYAAKRNLLVITNFFCFPFPIQMLGYKFMRVLTRSDKLWSFEVLVPIYFFLASVAREVPNFFASACWSCSWCICTQVIFFFLHFFSSSNSKNLISYGASNTWTDILLFNITTYLSWISGVILILRVAAWIRQIIWAHREGRNNSRFRFCFCFCFVGVSIVSRRIRHNQFWL